MERHYTGMPVSEQRNSSLDVFGRRKETVRYGTKRKNSEIGGGKKSGGKKEKGNCTEKNRESDGGRERKMDKRASEKKPNTGGNYESPALGGQSEKKKTICARGKDRIQNWYDGIGKETFTHSDTARKQNVIGFDKTQKSFHLIPGVKEAAALTQAQPTMYLEKALLQKK